MSLDPVKQKRNNAVISKMQLSEQIRDYLRWTTITLHPRDVDYTVNIFRQTRELLQSIRFLFLLAKWLRYSRCVYRMYRWS